MDMEKVQAVFLCHKIKNQTEKCIRIHPQRKISRRRCFFRRTAFISESRDHHHTWKPGS